MLQAHMKKMQRLCISEVKSVWTNSFGPKSRVKRAKMKKKRQKKTRNDV